MFAPFTRRVLLLLAVVSLAAAVPTSVHAQAITAHGVLIRPFSAHVIIPQSRAYAVHSGAAASVRNRSVEITDVTVGVVILEQAATTTMDISLRNPSSTRQEAELLVPVPEDAAVRGFTFQGSSSEPTATLLPKDEARKIYDAIVAKARDPALLEFVGSSLIRSSVFPVEAGGTQKVRLTYEHLLPADGERVDYVLPRSENLDYRVPWQISVKIKGARPVSTVYSPSHRLETTRTSDATVSARVPADAAVTPGSFRLSYLYEKGGVSASLFTYPDPRTGGGYFLLLAGLPARPAATDGALKREVTIVLDRSGSMNGEKMEQAREAALQIIAGLEPGESFNVIAYNEGVDPFANAPVVKTDETVARARAWVKGIQARGGTNIHDALLESLRPKPTPGTLPLVLFLTDGLPTFGQTSEIDIRNMAVKANPYGRRIFTFGVGVDVNTPLLEKIASETRAVATFVLPRENVEVKVGGVFRRLSGPVLAEPQVSIVGKDGKQAAGRVRDVLPSKLADLFEGDQLVLLGQYVGDEPLTFQLEGNYLGKKKSFAFRFELDKATTRNAFVPRLWASRKIALLVDAIRQDGADNDLASANPKAGNPRMKELVDEIVRLSKEFGILTEYTAFLAREGTDLSQKDQVLAEAGRNFRDRAINTRSGLGSVNQELNGQYQKAQICMNYDNGYYDAGMNRVSISTVQQVNDKTFYRRGGGWVDGAVIDRATTVKPERVIEFGSPEFRELVTRLASEGRQGSISLSGDILMVLDGKTVLVKAPKATETALTE